VVVSFDWFTSETEATKEQMSKGVKHLESLSRSKNCYFVYH